MRQAFRVASCTQHGALTAALPNPRCTQGETAFFPGGSAPPETNHSPQEAVIQPQGRTASQLRLSLSQEASAAQGKTKQQSADCVTRVWSQAPDVVPARWAHACQSSSDNRATGTSAFSGPARRAAASMQIQEYLLIIFYRHSQEQAPSLTITFPAPSSTVPGTEQMFNQVTNE